MKKKNPVCSELKSECLEMLHTLHLGAMQEELERISVLPEFEKLSHLEWLRHLLDRETEERGLRRKARLIKESGLGAGDPSRLEKLVNCKERNINESLINSIKTCDWLVADFVAPILITGATGTGKTFLAKAIGKNVIDHSMAVFYTRLQQLIEMMHEYGAQHRMASFRGRMSHFRLLIIDDWGLAKLEEQDVCDLLSLFDDRIGRSGLIISSQLAVSDWYEYIGDAYRADAIMDRLKNGSYEFELTGESMRKLMHPSRQKGA